jgi:hypothetical protein
MRFFLRLLPIAALALAGCGSDSLPFGLGSATVSATEAVADTPRPEARPAALRPPEGARTVEQFDTTTPAERAAAAAPAAASRQLGTTIASLGNPAEAGFWLKTPLVMTETPGRVTLAAVSVNVDLIPSGTAPGSGSQLSLAAFRLLPVALTSLPELTVFSR